MSLSRTLILILLFAAGLRLYALGRASFWYDEFGSLEASTGRGLAHLKLPLNQIIVDPPHFTSLQNAPPAWRIWTSLNLDNHPPLYFLLLRFTRDMLGDSEWAVRLLSVICSLVSLLFFFGIVRKQLGDAPALAATALMALAGSQITLAQEARPYALWLALSLVCAWIVLRIERRGISWVLGVSLCVSAWAALLTHYFAVPILFSLLTYTFLRVRGRHLIGTLGALATASVLFIGSWADYLVQQLNKVSANNAWQYDDAPHHAMRIVWHLIQLPARWLSESAAGNGIAALLVFSAVIYAIFHSRRQPGILFWLLWATPLLFFIAAMDAVRHTQSLYFMRYTFAAAPSLFFLFGACAQNNRRGWIVPIVSILLCIITLPDAYSKVMDWRNVAIEMRSQIHSGDTIIFAPGANAPSWSQTALLGIFHYAPDLPVSSIILTDPKAPVLGEVLKQGRNTWVICTDSTLPANALAPEARVVSTGIAPSIGRISQLIP
jgi:uncharacterized membrane protein